MRMGAGRHGKGGHSGGAALMVAQRMAMLNRRCCDGGEVGLSLVGLGQIFGVSVRGRTTAPWHQTGADLTLIQGHPLCFWIMPDCR